MQRYVSDELFHFVGRDKGSEEDQYQLLKKILKEKKLGVGSSEWQIMAVNHAETLSDNEVYDAMIVCFCDIPMDDLMIHMKKYSRFGLSFLKTYLIDHGASPVWYISKTSNISSSESSKNGEYHDENHKKFMSLWTDEVKKNSLPDDAGILFEYLNKQIFPFMKFFDPSKDEKDEENYYMEREWRVFGVVDFGSLDYVERVIFPKEFAERFRIDFPDYFGQIEYSK